MYQPKTGERCHCKRGIQRDNCPDCEGTGWRVDFRAIRERSLALKVESASCLYGSPQNCGQPEYSAEE